MNKKIGVLTQPLINNYGGILQAYALTTVLSYMGYDAEIIDRKHDYDKQTLKRAIKVFIKKYILKRKISDLQNAERIISVNTLKFVKDNIPLSKEIFFSSNIMNINNYNYSAIIVGSDQVWRPTYSPGITNYFLDFCQDNSKIKKIAYAASFGTTDWEYSEKETAICKKLTKNFDAISVREDAGIQLCKEKLDVDSVQVLDPTLLLDKTDYIDLVHKYNEPESEGQLMCYVLDKNNNKQAIIDHCSIMLSLKTFTIMPNKKLNKHCHLSPESDFEYPPLTKWLKGFMDAEFVITDSFHGCVFSIIFNKPFIAIGNKDRGLARFTSLLKLFNLEDRLILAKKDLSPKHLSYVFDWDAINKIKENKKEFSLLFLKQNIGL